MSEPAHSPSSPHARSGVQSVLLKGFTEYKAAELEAEILSYWTQYFIPQRLSEKHAKDKPFFLLDGPPYINGLPHVGHVKSTTYKDIWTRVSSMRGRNCFIQPGFDCHGLPVEVMVEKELGIESKQQILQMGIDKFDAACLSKILNNEKAWMGYYASLGAWRAFFEPYFTYKADYIESAWWTFSRLHEKGLVKEGRLSIHWCPHCETALSGYEVSDSYKEATDPSLLVQFPLKGKPDEYLLVWTTTPWTLPANCAIVVHPEETYAKIRVSVNGRTIFLWVGEKRLEAVAKLAELPAYSVVERVNGKFLQGWEYLPAVECKAQASIDNEPGARKVYLSVPVLAHKKYKKHVKSEEAGSGTQEEFSYVLECGECKAKQTQTLSAATIEARTAVCIECGSKKLTVLEKNFPAKADAPEEFEEFVTLSEGTGLVHCAPGHGQTDNLFGKRMGIPALSPINEQGCFTPEVELWAGQFVKQADKKILDHLKSRGMLLYSATIRHSYPLCWRCKTPLLFRLSNQLYIAVEAIKERMLAETRKVKWMPPYGEEALGNWVANAGDWCVSQQRFWGIPIPLWKCNKCGSQKIIASREELRAQTKTVLGPLDDLHRHVVDAIIFPCTECEGEMHRIPDIFTVWFDSAVAPWASLGYPWKNKALFEKMFPVDLVDESQDQVRGWFYVLLVAGVGVFDRAPYKAVAMNGWVVDEKGQKMSKSLGNVVSATDAIAKSGADSLRLYYCRETAPWDVQRFSFTYLQEIARSLNIYWNTFQFLKTYTAGDELPPISPDDATHFAATEDAWILSRLNSTVREVNSAIDSFSFDRAGKLMLSFLVDDFSRNYVKLIRDRMAVGAPEEGKRAASRVMRHVLLESTKLLAPFTPFVSEYVFQKLAGPSSQSVHFQKYPASEPAFINAQLEESMAAVSAVNEAAGALRQEAKVKLRWPLAELVIVCEKRAKPLFASAHHLLSQQANVQVVSVREEPPVGEHWHSKEVRVTFEGTAIIAKACLNAFVSPRLLQVALVRELARAIQGGRKHAGLQVHDRIAVTVWSDSKETREMLSSHRETLSQDVGASEFTIVDAMEKISGEWEASAEAESLHAISKCSLVKS